MGRETAAGAAFVLLLACVMFPPFNAHTGRHGWELSTSTVHIATDVIVPDDYSTIQAAIANANEGDTIFVSAGTYHEHLAVNKTVSLVGEGPSLTTINGNGTGRTVSIEADNVTLSNFRIEAGGLNIISNDCSLFINGSNSQILNNEIGRGSVISFLADTLCFGTIIENNSIAGGARGLILLSSNTTIRHNQVEASGLLSMGIYGVNNTIANNSIRNSGGYPLLLDNWSQVSGNWIELATAYDGFSGVNIIAGSSSEGHNTLTNNTIICNALASIDVFAVTVASSSNTIHHNSFFNYTKPALIEQPTNNAWDSGYPSGGNYWSDYNGTDLYSGPYQNETASDRIGDTPHTFDAHNIDSYPLLYPHRYHTMPWDITGPTKWIHDSKCDIRDIALTASLFGTEEGDGSYDQRADIAGTIYLLPNRKIDIRDIALVATYFGEEY